jgi:hypothetical protein
MKVIDLLLDTRLFEMAFNRKDAINNTLSHTATLRDHLIKIHTWPDNRACGGWKGTVREIADSIQGTPLKRGNRQLDKATLKDILWNKPMEPNPTAVVVERMRMFTSGGYTNPLPPSKSDIACDVANAVKADVQSVIEAIHNGTQWELFR